MARKTPHKMRERLLNLLLIATVLLGSQWYAARGLVSGAPPLLSGQTVTGKEFNLAEFNGRASVIYFWASWCGICGQMRSSIADVAQTAPLISVAMQSGDALAVSRYQTEHDFHPNTLLDESGAIARSYGVKAVPALFILDPQGNVRYATSGFTTTWGIRLRLWLADQPWKS